MGLISRVSSRTYRYFYTFEDTSYFVENFKKCLNSVPKPSNDSLNAELPNEKPSKDSMKFAELWKSEQPLLFSWPAMSKTGLSPPATQWNNLKLLFKHFSRNVSRVPTTFKLIPEQHRYLFASAEC